MKQKFSNMLMKWHRLHNSRQMPWKGEKDPYKIWLSEIILQQTRVEQGLAYYNRFIQHYPTIQQLAAAPDQEVLKLWEGLGYYSRCRNLLLTARRIVKEYKGLFPRDYETLLSLKGVGPYTAAAIASFAYNQPYAVLDGNVFRVLSRFFGLDTAIDTMPGKKLFTGLADEVLDKQYPALFNQAIMDFGATVCKPMAPACIDCPARKDCAAFLTGNVNRLPVKEKTLQRKHRWFYYFIFEHRGNWLVNQRNQRDIWQGLFEFYLLETEAACEWNDKKVMEWLHDQYGIADALLVNISSVQTQQLTHQQIRGQFIELKLSSKPDFLKSYQWQPKKRLKELPFPRFITQFLEEHASIGS